MMSGRPGRVPLQFLPNEARSLPPPKLTDPRLVFCGFLGYCAGLVDNAIRHRPVVAAGELHMNRKEMGSVRDVQWTNLPNIWTGLHRQLLYVTSFFFVGYYLLKRQDYIYAVRDHDMFGYIKSHQEDFPEKDKKTYAEILEEFHPVR
ncbi:NADH dehydrogenase [ubiquinone] 1 subunit C2 isoform 1-T1 [Dugong dugon]